MPMPVKFKETKIAGVLLVEVGCFRDDRGFFSEVHSEAVWRDAGFPKGFVQDNLSLSKRGTLRGMHYQILPNGMGKLVRVIKGAVYDVGVDLRQGSPTFGKWIGFDLVPDAPAVYFPPGFAHGFVALEDESLVYYKCTGMHSQAAERSVLYSDPVVGIQWPLEPWIVSQKDAAAPVFENAEKNFEFDPENVYG